MKILLNNFQIRLKSWIAGGSWNHPVELRDKLSHFEIIRRSRLNGTRKGNVIPLPVKSKQEQLSLADIKKMMREVNALPKWEREKWQRDLRICKLPFASDN